MSALTLASPPVGTNGSAGKQHLEESPSQPSKDQDIQKNFQQLKDILMYDVDFRETSLQSFLTAHQGFMDAVRTFKHHRSDVHFEDDIINLNNTSAASLQEVQEQFRAHTEVTRAFNRLFRCLGERIAHLDQILSLCSEIQAARNEENQDTKAQVLAWKESHLCKKIQQDMLHLMQEMAGYLASVG